MLSGPARPLPCRPGARRSVSKAGLDEIVRCLVDAADATEDMSSAGDEDRAVQLLFPGLQ
jgi:hypothetical protein